MSWSFFQTPEFTPTTTVTITDTPSGWRHAGPDGAIAIDVPISGDTPGAVRHAGPNGAVSVELAITDTPGCQRSGGPDGSLIIGTVLTDTPGGQRHNGPVGAPQVDLAVTDTPGSQRLGGPDGVQGSGVSFGPDTPTGWRSAGPDGAVTADLTITDNPRGTRYSGPTGSLTLGVAIGPDTPGGCRSGGPTGSVFADTAGGVTLTDTTGSTRSGGSDGSLALGISLTGDTPGSSRMGGGDGLLAIGIVLTDTPGSSRYAGSDGLVSIIAGGTDTPGAYRSMGPDGSMGIEVPVTGDTPGGSRYGGPIGILVIGIGSDITTGPTGPSGNRYGGPVGQVLIAVLPIRLPYVTPAPLVIPRYALWVADTRTGRMLWELPMSGCAWSTTLGAVGTIRVTLEVEKTWDSLTDQDERDPRILLREVLTGPWRFSLVLLWGNNVVWAGPYVSLNRPGPSKVELGGSEIGAVFNKRILIAPGAVSATDPTADTTLGPGTTKPHAAAVLLQQLTVGNGNNLPITVTDPGGFGTDSRIYYGYDLRTYWETLSALSAEVDGPELRFDPLVSPGVDGNYLSWTAQIGNPHVGRTGTVWEFDSDVTAIVGFDSDASTQALGVWSGGSGTSRDKLITHASDTSLLPIGWPMIEEVDTANSSETVYPVLLSKTAAVLASHKQAVSAFQVQVPADADPMVGTYRVGEDFAVDIRDDPVIPDGLYTRRIAGLAGTEKPWVTITDANPLPVGSL